MLICSPCSVTTLVTTIVSTGHSRKLIQCLGCAGLLFCEEGLDVEEAGLCGGSEGDCSPRCSEDLGDTLSMSASTSDSQHSEGASLSCRISQATCPCSHREGGKAVD